MVCTSQDGEVWYFREEVGRRIRNAAFAAYAAELAHDYALKPIDVRFLSARRCRGRMAPPSSHERRGKW